MSFAYLAWYTGDYLRDTRSLSMAGHGCYLLLIAYCWDSRGPLPLDDEEIAAICGARSQEERATMQRILSKFFTRMADGHYNVRIQKEIEKANAIGMARSDAGKKGYQARAKHLLSKYSASVSTPPPPLTPPPPPALQKSKALSSSQANVDALKLLQLLNVKTGKQYRPTRTTLAPIVARLAEFSFDECRGVVIQRCKAWLPDDKMREFLRPSTLFGATKFAQYVGDIPTREELEAMNA